jgi:Tol biopolymer transport system component
MTGKQAFHGEDVAGILAAVLRVEPDWSCLPETTPLAVRHLLRRCLQKDRRQRFHDAGDVRLEIEDAIAAPKDSSATQVASTSTSKLLLAVAVAVTIIAVVTSWGWWKSTRPVEQALRPLVRLDVDLGPDVSLGSLSGPDAILSPDGTRMVYVSQGRLFTRRLDQPNATELAGTQGAFAPFFSPDGLWIAFFAQGKLKKISVEGGASVTLCDAANGRGGSWGEDGTIVFTPDGRVALSKVSSAGGAPQPLSTLDKQAGEITQRWPQVLPGGKAVLYTSSTHGYHYEDADIIVYSMASGQRKTVLRGGSYARYLPSGQMVYMREGTLFAVAFDLDRLEVRGTPVPVLDQVGYNAGTASAQVDFSQTGTLIYRSGGGGLVTVQWLDAAGKTQSLLAKADSYQHPSLSPDGSRLAINTTDIWVYEWQRDTMTRLTFGPATSTNPLWSPDGRYILFNAPGGMFWTRSDGSGKPQPLTQSKNFQFPWSFTPDGNRLAFIEFTPETRYDIWTVPLERDDAGLRAGKPEPFLQSPSDERHPSFSTDGRWMAYDSNESGSYQVYVRAFPDKGGKWQISNSSGVYPEWSRNGRELFFRTDDNQIMVASYTVKSNSFVADKPRVWSEKKIANIGLQDNYDLAPDGKRIAAIMPAETVEAQNAQSHVIFLENFFDEMRRRTATQAK